MLLSNDYISDNGEDPSNQGGRFPGEDQHNKGTVEDVEDVFYL